MENLVYRELYAPGHFGNSYEVMADYQVREVLQEAKSWGYNAFGDWLDAAGRRLWEGLVFRDCLRAHPETAKEYKEPKYHLAEIHHFDREAYTDAKGAFVREITDRAKKEVG